MKLNRLFFILLPALIALLCACTRQQAMQTDSFYAMNTYVSITLPQSEKARFSSIRRYVEDIESTFSRTRPESDLYRVNHTSVTEVSPVCADVLLRAQGAARTTDGAFNPCLGSIIELWDITGKAYIPTEEERTAALAECDPLGYTVEGKTVTKQNPQTLLDLGAVVKGYAAGELLHALRESGIDSALINFGGNVALCGHAPGRTDGWRVGVKNPFLPDEIALTLTCTDTVIAVSGDYERYFERDGVRYHHIFDGSTGKPAASGLVSCAVVCEDGFTADMLSTALFVMGKERAYELWQSGVYDFEALLFAEDGKIYVTDGLLESVQLVPTAQTQAGVPLVLEKLEETF